MKTESYDEPQLTAGESNQPIFNFSDEKSEPHPEIEKNDLETSLLTEESKKGLDILDKTFVRYFNN